MAIDPNIALQVRPPQFADPMESYSKMLSLRGMIQQGQLHGEQLKGAQLENQQHQMALDQTKALNSAYQDSLTVGADGTPTIDTGRLTKALGAGGHGSAIPTVLKGVMDFQKAGSELSKLNTEVADKRADYGGIVGATMAAANHDPRLFLVKAQQALQAKALPPEVVQPYIDHVNQLLEQDPTGESARQVVKQISDQLIAASPAQQKLINEGKTSGAAVSRAESAAKAAGTGATRLELETPGIQADAAQKTRGNAAAQLGAATDQAGYAKVWNALPAGVAMNFPQPAQFDPQTTPAQVRQLGMSAHEQSQAETAAKNAENNVSEYELRLRAAKGDANAKKALADSATEKIRVASVEAQNKWNLQMGSLAAADGEPSEMAKSVANYQAPLTQALSRVPFGMRDAIMQQIRKANPDFDAKNYDTARATELDAAKGKIGTTANAQSTALAHLEVLHDAALALKNSDIRILNKLANGLGVQMGSTAKTTYDAIVHKVGPELSSAYIAGGGAVGERGATEHDFSSDGGPQQILDNIAISAKLLAGKVKGNQEQYDRGTYGRGKQELLSKDAKAALEKLSSGSGGSVPNVTTKEQFDALPKGAIYMEDGHQYRKP